MAGPDDSGGIVIVFAEDDAAAADTSGEARRPPQRWFVTACVAIVLVLVVVVIRQHLVSSNDHHAAPAPMRPAVPVFSRAPQRTVDQFLCRSTCETSEAPARLNSEIAAAITKAFGAPRHLQVRTLTSTAVPGTERSLLQRRITATVPTGSLVVTVSAAPSDYVPFGNAPTEQATVTVMQSDIDDYYIYGSAWHSKRDGPKVTAALRTLVNDVRLIAQR